MACEYPAYPSFLAMLRLDQWCYQPAPCARCGLNGCDMSVSRVEAQEIMAAAINKALVTAGGEDIEVDPETIMAGIEGPRVRKKSKKS